MLKIAALLVVCPIRFYLLHKPRRSHRELHFVCVFFSFHAVVEVQGADSWTSVAVNHSQVDDSLPPPCGRSWLLRNYTKRDNRAGKRHDLLLRRFTLWGESLNTAQLVLLHI